MAGTTNRNVKHNVMKAASFFLIRIKIHKLSDKLMVLFRRIEILLKTVVKFKADFNFLIVLMMLDSVPAVRSP